MFFTFFFGAITGNVWLVGDGRAK